MTESIFLAILGAIAAIALFVLRKRRPLSSRMDAITRYASMLVAAFIAHLVYASTKNMGWFIVAVAVNAVFLYGLTHLVDRLLTAGAGVLNLGKRA